MRGEAVKWELYGGVKSGTRRMRSRWGSVTCEEGQGEWFGMGTALCWVMHRQPHAAGIQYCLLLLPGLGVGGGCM